MNLGTLTYVFLKTVKRYIQFGFSVADHWDARQVCDVNLGWKSSCLFIDHATCPYRLEAVVQRQCQTLWAGTAAENEYVPCCVALHLHRQLCGEQILLLVLFWRFFPPSKLVFSQIRFTIQFAVWPYKGLYWHISANGLGQEQTVRGG